MAVAASPRTLRALMAERDVFTFRALERLSGVANTRITLVSQGWKGPPSVRASLAKALRCKASDILAAARAAHGEAQ